MKHIIGIATLATVLIGCSIDDSKVYDIVSEDLAEPASSIAATISANTLPANHSTIWPGLVMPDQVSLYETTMGTRQTETWSYPYDVNGTHSRVEDAIMAQFPIGRTADWGGPWCGSEGPNNMMYVWKMTPTQTVVVQFLPAGLGTDYVQLISGGADGMHLCQ